VLQKNLKEYDDKNGIKENLKIEISNYENKKLQYKSKISQFFHKKEIINITDKIREKNEKLNKLEDEINILKKEIEKLKIEKNNLSKILKFVKNDKMCLSNLSLERLNNSNFNRNQLDIVDWSKINENLLNLKENLQIVLPYLNKEYFNDLYSRLSQQLIEQFEKNSFYNIRINRLESFINMYIKLFFT
jgi:predicted  nucleic acid-binding Zn-ribbon protein